MPEPAVVEPHMTAVTPRPIRIRAILCGVSRDYKISMKVLVPSLSSAFESFNFDKSPNGVLVLCFISFFG